MSAPIASRPTLAELFDLPESIGAQDYVLRLAEAIRRPADTVRHYVVTDQLSGCFDEALTVIREALRAGTSKAAYLHGSFGTGKSHFMAMLYLLLSGEPTARSHARLARVADKHKD